MPHSESEEFDKVDNDVCMKHEKDAYYVLDRVVNFRKMQKCLFISILVWDLLVLGSRKSSIRRAKVWNVTFWTVKWKYFLVVIGMTFVCFPLSLVLCSVCVCVRAETTRKTKSGGGGGVISARRKTHQVSTSVFTLFSLLGCSLRVDGYGVQNKTPKVLFRLHILPCG